MAKRPEHFAVLFPQPPVPPSSSSPAPVNIDEELIPGPPSILPPVPEVKRERASSLGSIPSIHGPVKFNSETSINQHRFVPVCPSPVTIFQPPPAPQALPPNPRLAPQPSFVTPDSEKFHMCNASVITHTASATLTHNPSATTFSQSQNLILTTQQRVPCNISVQTTGVMQQTSPQSQGYFTLSSSGAKQKKKPPKIVPAPQKETVSLLFTPGKCSVTETKCHKSFKSLLHLKTMLVTFMTLMKCDMIMYGLKDYYSTGFI